jgi:hypothetical protein
LDRCWVERTFPHDEYMAHNRLADPVNQYPRLFGNSGLFTRYPYALPNLVTASLLLLSCIFGFLFLAETHDAKKGKLDCGMRIRQLVGHLFRRQSHRHSTKSKEHEHLFEIGRTSDEESLSSGEHADSVLLSPSSQWSGRSANIRRRSSDSTSIAIKSSANGPQPSPRPRFRDAFTKQVLLNMFMFAGVSVQNNTFGQLFPLLCSTKTEDGGLGMTPGQIGAALSAAGIMAVLFQVTIFPWGYNKWGGIFCLRVILAIYPLLYFVRPL